VPVLPNKTSFDLKQGPLSHKTLLNQEIRTRGLQGVLAQTVPSELFPVLFLIAVCLYDCELNREIA
jgi:hypothetical protein